jgi:hypothetical protein
MMTSLSLIPQLQLYTCHESYTYRRAAARASGEFISSEYGAARGAVTFDKLRRAFQGGRQLMFSESELEEKHFGVACGVGRQGAGRCGKSGLVDGCGDEEVSVPISCKTLDSLTPGGI